MRADWSPNALQAMLSGLQLLIDGDVQPARVLCYAGALPNNPGDAAPGALQVSIALAKPSGTILGTALDMTVPAEGQRVDGQVITWARLINGAGFWVADFDVGLAGGIPPASIELDRLDGYTGAFVRLTGGLIAF